MNFELLFLTSTWASLLTLTAMEIVLGIDNIVFISVLVSRLPPDLAKRARQIGLLLALVFRILLLLILSWLIGLTEPVVTLFGRGLSWRDIILLAGGLFLIYKATHEIHQGVEGDEHDETKPATAGFGAVIAQIVVIDMVFSIDSIVTAIGMAEHVEIMIAAVLISMAVMYAASGAIASFIQQHPTTKMLALAFLLMIGIALVADGIGFHIPRGYIYTAMAFSALVEVLNIWSKNNRAKARLRRPE
ncbi:TerC family protein [Kaistia dalseonensis]|uniref:Tellurium resistance membrane protein TerC n=1 Tax=Kaistia dalseonensis TaxID=410840 RepID=A0ABU0H427_9HYPH|nr:TerC family protein [Kaistia dalseonensis]MCX5493964.1 TerC family protein [Kaistia dalseonensis]MDQ0436540.1 putative tellurium resistance membrane protein TerC [Kaistia dalseonensis]